MPTFGASQRMPHEWQTSTSMNLSNAMRAQKLAEEQHSMSMMSHDATWNSNVSEYQNVHNNFSHKVDSTNSLVQLLQERISSVNTSINLSKQNWAALQTAHRAKEAPLQLCGWRMEMRAKRPERELVRDPCEIALEEEKDTLSDAQDKLGRNADKTERMLKALAKMLGDLTHDLDNKQHSVGIDKKCMGTLHRTWPTSGRGGGGDTMMRTPRGGRAAATAFAGSMPPIDTRSMSMGRTAELGVYHDSTDPARQMCNAQQEEQRQEQTVRLTQTAKELERNALSLRDDSCNLIQKTNQDCNFAKNQVEHALDRRISETQALRKHLETAVSDSSRSIAKMMHCNSMTQANMDSHNEPADLYATRVKFREQRLPRENIGDPVKSSLDRHAESLKMNHATLQGCYSGEANAIAHLEQMKSNCEADLRDKMAALQIDLKCKNQTQFDNRLSYEAMMPRPVHFAM